MIGRAAQRRRRQRRLQVRRQRLPDQTLQRDQLLGRRDVRPHDPAGHRGPGRVTETTPAAAAQRRRAATPTVEAEFDEPLAPPASRPHDVHAADAERRRRAGDRQLRRADAHAPSSPARRRWPTTATYTATLKGGAAASRTSSGNPLAADKTWTFTVAGQSPAEGPGGPILLVTDPADPFGTYYAEILRGEGLNAFSTADGPVTAAMLTGKTTVAARHAARSPTPRSRCSRTGSTAAAT